MKCSTEQNFQSTIIVWEGGMESVVNGLVVPKPPSRVSAGMSVSGWLPEQCLHLDLPALVTSWPWWRAVLHWRVKTGVGSVSRGAGTKPNLPDRSVRPTLRFGSESIFITGNFVKRLLTYLGKFGQTAEARMWLFTTTASSKTTVFLRGKRGN